jgi:ribosomal protein S18 acetylase RimI-like enzyme
MSAAGIISGHDKQGEPFEAEDCGLESEAELARFYEGFHPRGIAQGLPPPNDEQCRAWLRMLLEAGPNFLVRQAGQVVGHAVLMVDMVKKDGEYVVFVLAQYRDRGLGSVLTTLAMERAKALGLACVWLTVEAYNFRAIKVYKKVGFEFCDAGERERTMVLRP